MNLLIPLMLIVFGIASATIWKAYKVYCSVSPGFLQALISFLWLALYVFTAGLAVHMIREFSHEMLFFGFNLIYIEYIFYLIFYIILLYSVFHLYYLYHMLGFGEQRKQIAEALREQGAIYD